ncbi:MAG: polysaccharide biosynthesis tyrosine autokinase [Candidatus Omnitrophica bacterium]|nr:polysaccharide biosynthesis tyrosine autokinase [Candidatus Omnitrophota bacterium]
MPQYELNLRDYWVILRKRKTIVFLTFGIVLALTAAYTLLEEPAYKASATVSIAEKKTFGKLLTEVFVVSPGDPLLSQSRIIKSKPVAEAVVRELNLAGTHPTEEEFQKMVSSVEASISTEIVTNTNLIRIDVVNRDPRKAAAIANVITKAFVVENLKEKNKQARSVREFVEKRMEEIKEKLRASEVALMEFRRKEAAAGIAVPLQNKLVELESKRAELLLTYTELHPDVVKIKEQIQGIKERLEKMSETELEFARLTREFQMNEKAYRELEDRFHEAQFAEAEEVSDVNIVDPASVPVRPMKPDRVLNLLMGVIVGLTLSFVSAFVTEHLDTSLGTIEDIESVIKLPVLGVIPHLPIRGEEKKSFREKVSIIKDVKEDDKLSQLKQQLIINYPNKSPIIEAYRILYTSIQIEVFGGELNGKNLLLTSTGPGEGKSITIANLGLTMAQMGKRVLLIDADLRRSIIHKIFGFKDKKPGLADILLGTATESSIRGLTDFLIGLGWDEALKIPGIDNLNVLTSGSTVQNPAELLGSQNMVNFLKKMREKYDVVLLDSPPVLAVTDPSVLAPNVNAVILLYEAGKISRSALHRAKIQLESVKAPVKGVVLNNISPEVEMYSSYYYHYKPHEEKPGRGVKET